MGKKGKEATAVANPTPQPAEKPASTPAIVTVTGGDSAERQAFDPAQMDAAAAVAQIALSAIIHNPEAKPMDILHWYRNPNYGYMKAGHKRLGRMMAATSKAATSG